MSTENSYKMRASTRRTRQAILDVFDEQEPPLTVRQVYYQLTVKGAIPKTEAGYRSTCYHLKHMRLDGTVPYGWLADNARYQLKPDSYPGMAAALDRFRKAYRRDLWAQQPDYVEIWVEKDALAGVISRVTSEFDVPLYVARGYSSMSFLFEAAEGIKAHGKRAFVYHFGDYDPSGVDAAFKIRDGLREHGADIEFERAAVTTEQIDAYQLPTRPTKKRDPRAKTWGDRPSVELDAMPAPLLRQLVQDAIVQHIDADEWRRAQRTERLERETLQTIISNSNFGASTKFGGQMGASR